MIDFFAIAPATESFRSSPHGFWLCDPGGNNMAFSSSAQRFDAQACVCIKSGSVRFVPIDNNPQYDGVGGRCDGFLHDVNRESLAFVELKDRGVDNGLNEAAWQKKAIAQLSNTIKYFKQCHANVDRVATHKQAVIANKQCPYKVGSSIASQQAKFFSAPETAGYILSKTNDISMP